MTNAATFVSALLWLVCYGNGLIDGLLAGTGGKSSAQSRRSCKPLGSFLACYDVVVPVYPIVLGAAADRPVEIPVSMTAFGRPFRLRLQVDDLSDADDGHKREMSWSWVMSPSTVVRVVGDTDDDVREYRLQQLGGTWYVGHDQVEVAPSSVLASVVDVDDTQVFSAIIHTTSDVYYVQPASDFPGV